MLWRGRGIGAAMMSTRVALVLATAVATATAIAEGRNLMLEQHARMNTAQEKQGLTFKKMKKKSSNMPVLLLAKSKSNQQKVHGCEKQAQHTRTSTKNKNAATVSKKNNKNIIDDLKLDKHLSGVEDLMEMDLFTSTGGEKSIQSPGFQYPFYGPQAFNDAATNPWKPGTIDKTGVAADLHPTAPLDKTVSIPSAIDVLRPNEHPHTFPRENGKDVCRSTMETKLDDRTIIAKNDILRKDGPGLGAAGVRKLKGIDSVTSNYPLKSPFDGSAEAAAADQVDKEYSRFFDQLHDDEKRRQAAQDRVAAFKTADGDSDQMISWNEFQNVVQTNKGKSADETQELWNLHKNPGGETMPPAAYQKLVGAGFDTDLHRRTRTDVISHVSLACPVPVGSWGALSLCPQGGAVTKARIQLFGTSENADNSGINTIELGCNDADGTLLQSASGKEGVWSEWNTCPAGMVVSGFRGRNMIYSPHVADNSALNDVGLICRSQLDASMTIEMRFGEKPEGSSVQYAPFASGEEVPQVSEGGWSNQSLCRSVAATNEFAEGASKGPHEAICGVQTRVGSLEADNLGVTDVRFYCCDLLKRVNVGFLVGTKITTGGTAGAR
ncbi:unnamed protein product [Amoebophrya sp. A25]|nr:unnamed protein product [Amoebophrya sp. A25]|eukprot:GSA25T00019462001.1